MEEALSEHFERHRDLEEQIIMVDNEIANRRQKAYSQREKEENEEKEKKKEAQAASNSEIENAEKQKLIDSDEEDEDDPFKNMDPDEIDEERRMVWIMAFAICHKDFEEAEKKLNMYQTKYQYVVPRHEQEEMKRSIIEQKFGAKNLVDEKSVLEEELGNLKELEAKLEEELAQVKEQLTELRTTVTPRPSWEQLGEFIHGGVPKWERMIQGKSTKDVTEKLFSELRSRRGAEKFFQPLGVDHSVLRCLRYGKKVSDRQLHSRDAALLIHDIWLSRKKALDDNLKAPAKAKNEFDFGGNQNVAEKGFPDYVAIYFEDFYEDEAIRMEWTYNLVECCKRFSLDYRLTLFLDVLMQHSDEGLYFATRNELFRVRNAFLQKSVDEGMPGGTLSSNQYVEALEAIFPEKDEPQIQSIVRVTNKMNQELNGGVEGADLSIYKITQLIDMRDDGFRGVVVGELVKQFEKDRQLFIDKIVETLAGLFGISVQSAQSEHDPASNRDVNVVDVYEAIKKTDPNLDDDVVGAALAWIFTQTSVLPGGGISTSRLVNYCKLHSGEGESVAQSMVSMVPSQDVAHMDEEQFERAIKDIVREDEDEEREEHLSEAQKKALYKSFKITKLRTVVKRLKGSALVASGKTYDPVNDSELPEDAIDLETDLKLLKKEEVPHEEKRGSKEIPQHMIDEWQLDEDGEEVSFMGTGENSEAASTPGTAPSVPATPTTPNTPNTAGSDAGASPAAGKEAGGPSAASLPT